MGKGRRGPKAASSACASDGSSRHRTTRSGCGSSSLALLALVRDVEVWRRVWVWGGVGTDIRHPLERDRRALTPLSRTRNSDRVTHWQWEACDHGAFDVDSIVIRPPPSTFHGETYCIIEGPLLFIF